MCNPAALKAAEELHARSKGYSTSVNVPCGSILALRLVDDSVVGGSTGCVPFTSGRVLGRRFISGIHVKAYAALGLQCVFQTFFQNFVEAGGFVEGASSCCAGFGRWELL